ncbi:peptide ABC transporter substrate-binding protein [Vallitalea pronyensis]|uniref:Peptide ABC transporter substrate-binding protein n=1 Tax=Vallitalea pronyensis TaxID=1348613 RepID=A0A8J8MH62_9FIRM|nr:peptide ABC transporter substrate-binding protein [Vallitalea pronyensis]QUI21737.1 peptide ABC transporter substrate-binding protein [Vallitalea pronyensis]
MKKLLALLLVLTMTLSLAACGSNTDKPATGDDTDPATEGEKEPDNNDGDKDNNDGDTAEEPKVINLLESENIPSLVTWLATDAVSFRVLGNVVSGLYILGVDGTPQKELVESEEIAPDGLKYTFKLKKGVQWMTVDGEPYAEVTAHDFVFAWKKLLDPTQAAQYSTMIRTAGIKNGSEAVVLNDQIVKFERDTKELDKIAVTDYEDTDEQTAQQQFDAAKKELEASVKEKGDAINEKFGSIDGAKEELNKLIDSLAIKAVDDYTLEIELAYPVPYFKDLMTFGSFMPASEKFFNEVGEEKYGKTVENFLYNGTYIFKEWKLSERHYLVKNEGYWDAANVDIDALDYRVIEGGSNDTSVQMYLSGEVDRSVVTGENVDKHGNRPDAVPMGEAVIFYIELNMNNGKMTPAQKVLRNVDARKAINMAIDKSYITDVILKNGSVPADFFVPKNFVASSAHDGKGFREVAQDMYNGGNGYNALDPAKAKELWAKALADTGVENVTMELIIYNNESSKKIGTHIKDELEKNLGNIEVEISPLPFADKIKRADEGDFEMNWAGWGPDYPDAMTFMDMWISTGSHNSGRYSNPYYDEGIEAAGSGELAVPTKAKERFEKFVELEKILLEEEQVIVPLYQRTRLYLMNPKIKNLVLQQFGADFIYKWVKMEE